MTTPKDRRHRLRQIRQETADNLELVAEWHGRGDCDRQELRVVQEEIIEDFLTELSMLLAQERDVEPDFLVNPSLKAAYGACCAYMDYRFDDGPTLTP